MMNCAKMAAGTLAATRFSVPVVGPLVCGAIGGCGGGFMPFDKGLGAPAARHAAQSPRPAWNATLHLMRLVQAHSRRTSTGGSDRL